MKSNYSEDRIYEDLHEVIEVLVRQDKSSRPSAFLWSKVADSVHKQLLYMIAAELSLPNPRLIPSKSLEKHSFSFLNGASLNGLYSYYKNRMVRKPGIHIITNICNKLNIPEVTLEDWFSFIKINNIFSWKSVPNIVKREILISASKELGYRHPLF
ncbi:MAG: hypothetical protein IMZ47_04915, partial [Firmicutes bacterium]|nr:hypothetical protein [Bacillota bacterium]